MVPTCLFPSAFYTSRAAPGVQAQQPSLIAETPFCKQRTEGIDYDLGRRSYWK
jgi:hypothetical protein